MWASSLDLRRFCRGVGPLPKPLATLKLNQIGIFSFDHLPCLASNKGLTLNSMSHIRSKSTH
jgi:hypothetical protein